MRLKIDDNIAKTVYEAEFPDGLNVRGLLIHLDYLKHDMLVMVNQAPARLDRELREGDEVYLTTVLAGG